MLKLVIVCIFLKREKTALGNQIMKVIKYTINLCFIKREREEYFLCMCMYIYILKDGTANISEVLKLFVEA